MDETKDKLILIIDDDENVQEFLKFALEHEGFRTCSETDGSRAVDIVNSCKPDLLILDMMIPQKSGFEILKSLQVSETRNIPIIVITGRFEDDKLKTMLQFESNVKDSMSKPVKPEILLHKIHTILGTISPAQKKAEEKTKNFMNNIKPK